MTDRLLIIGAGGHGKVIADIAVQTKQWKSIWFLDDVKTLKKPLGFEIIGELDDFEKYINDYSILVGIGNNTMRKRIQSAVESKGAYLPVLIHPNVVIGEQVKLGAGTVVMAGVVINCCTTVGEGCIINTGATIDHDNIIEDYVHISPGSHLAGSVKVGRCSWLGVGSVVNNDINITGDCVVGAGAVVIRNLTERGTYIGVPARKIGADY